MLCSCHEKHWGFWVILLVCTLMKHNSSNLMFIEIFEIQDVFAFTNLCMNSIICQCVEKQTHESKDPLFNEMGNYRARDGDIPFHHCFTCNIFSPYLNSLFKQAYDFHTLGSCIRNIHCFTLPICFHHSSKSFQASLQLSQIRFMYS